jgi:hypothetical protein
LLGLIHANVCRSMTIHVISGYTYFITFTDDHSRYGYVYLMWNTSLLQLKGSNNSKIKLKKQTGKSIKILLIWSRWWIFDPIF